MPKHIHADLMMQYAQDAMESETPWENWELLRRESVWRSLQGHPIWDENLEYRRKPRIIVINGFTVNAPMRKEPEDGSIYFYPNLTDYAFYAQSIFDSEWDRRTLLRGLCFSNKEDAIAMAKAMLRIDPNK